MSGRRLTCWRAGLAGLGALVLAVTSSGCGTDTTVPRALLSATTHVYYSSVGLIDANTPLAV